MTYLKDIHKLIKYADFWHILSLQTRARIVCRVVESRSIQGPTTRIDTNLFESTESDDDDESTFHLQIFQFYLQTAISSAFNYRQLFSASLIFIVAYLITRL